MWGGDEEGTNCFFFLIVDLKMPQRHVLPRRCYTLCLQNRRKEVSTSCRTNRKAIEVSCKARTLAFPHIPSFPSLSITYATCLGITPTYIAMCLRNACISISNMTSTALPSTTGRESSEASSHSNAPQIFLLS